MPKVVAIIQARLGSTRLPGKVLMDIGGKTALQWIVDAASAASLVGQVVVATPDIKLFYHCRDVLGVLGPEDNVLERFKRAAEQTGAMKIVRLTADCPFVDSDIIDECIQTNRCAVDEWPDGMDVQVFDASWLPMGDREHIIPVHNNLPQLPCPAGNLRHIRLTLDTAADLARLRAIAEHLPKDRPPRWKETLAAYAKLEKKAA